jgi:hypothetical protein
MMRDKDVSIAGGFCYLLDTDMVESRFVDLLAGLFGRARARLGDWPDRDIVGTTVAALRDCGGELHHESGSPAGELEVLHFRVKGRRMRLCIEEYGDVVLWGPKVLVAQVSKRVADRLAGAELEKGAWQGHGDE